MPGLDIMIVDDDRVFRTMLAEIIHVVTGDTPRTAADGADAIQMIREKAPDLIISDTNMPRTNGIELLQYVRSQHLRVTFVSLFSGLEGTNLSPDDVLVMGADLVLQKSDVPHKLTPFLKAVDSSCANKRGGVQ